MARLARQQLALPQTAASSATWAALVVQYFGAEQNMLSTSRWWMLQIIRGDVPACYFIVQVVDKVLLPDLEAINGTGEKDSNKGSISGTPGASMPYTVDA